MSPVTVPGDPVPERLSRRDLQSRAVSGATWTLIHVLVSLPMAFGVNVVVARVLGVADFGRLAYLTMVLEIVGVVVGVGLGASLVQFGAKAHSRGDHETVRRLLRGTQGFRVLVGAPVLTLAVLTLADVPVKMVVIAVIFGVWVPAAFGGATATLTIQNDTARAARLAMIMNVVTQVVVLVTVLVRPVADVVWSARMVVAGFTVLAAILLVQPRYRRAVLTPRPPTGMPLGFWRFAVPMGLSGVVATIALSRSEVVLLEHLSTAEQVGLYALAFGLAGHLFAPAQALLNPLTPAISALREVEPSAIRHAYRKTVRVSGTVAGAIIALGGPTLALLVPVLYGTDFAAARGLVLALVVVSGFLIVLYPMEAFVTARLRSDSILGLNFVSLVAVVAASVLLIPVVGAWGAVVGKMAMVLARGFWLGWRELPSFMVGRREFLATFRLPGAGALVAAVTYWGVDAGYEESALRAAFVALVASALLYPLVLLLVRGGLHDEDLEAIARALPARMSRALPVLRFYLFARRIEPRSSAPN